MKKISKLVSALALSAALSLGAAGAAFAAVTFSDYELTVKGTGEYTATDLFGNFKNVMPGDVLDQPVTVTNDNAKKVNVYMRAVAHDEAENPLTYSEPYEQADGKDQAVNPETGEATGIDGQRDETVATMSDFLSQLHMTVAVGDAVVFDAQPHLEAGLSDNVLLGEVAPGETMTINARLSVPIELGNEYANRVGEVDWVFVVEELDEPATGLSQTGDDMPVMIIGGIAIVALVVVAFAAMRRRSQQ